MSVIGKLNVGIVGAAGRGASFLEAFEANSVTRIHALCDIRKDAITEVAKMLGVSEVYTDYGEMLTRSELDIVVIGTPMVFHGPQAILALKQGIHVLSEVTAAVSLQECQKLVEADRHSEAVYMMAENSNYLKANVLVKELVRQGLFGDVYYAEGEYLHELKELNEKTIWRRTWQTGIDGITYGTHSLGPVLQWMECDRIVRVCCEGSGHHYRDSSGLPYKNQDSCVMLCKTSKGGLIKIRVDMLSERPHAMANYSLQGTRGCYESARYKGDWNKIWLMDFCEEKDVWMDLTMLEEKYLPDIWRDPPEGVKKAGHGGSDYFTVFEFVNSILYGKSPLIGIHEALDMTLPGLISQASVAEGGVWMDVPDSRLW